MSTVRLDGNHEISGTKTSQGGGGRDLGNGISSVIKTLLTAR